MRRWWLVFMVAVATFVAAWPAVAQTYITLDSAYTPTGSLYLRYGHLLKPPYIFETDSAVSDIYVRVDQDPAFNGTGVIRLPLMPPDPPDQRLISRAKPEAIPSAADQQTIDSLALVTRANRTTIDSLALVRYYAVRNQTGSFEMALKEAERIYNQYPDFVDSVRIVGTSYIRYWAGDRGIPHVMSFSAASQPPADSMKIARTYAQEKVKDLNNGRVLVVGPGGMICDPNLSPTVFAASLDSLQHGQNALRVIDNPRWLDELRQKKSALELVRLSEGGK